MHWLSKIFPPLSPEKFARKMLAALKAAGVDEGMQIDVSAFLLRNSKQRVLNLANFYSDYCHASPFARNAVFERAKRLMSSAQANFVLNWQRDKGSLLPRLRHRSYFEIIDLQIQPDLRSPESARQMISPELGFEIVYDTAESCMTVSNSGFTELGHGFDEVWPVARDNLYCISLKKYLEIEPGIFASPYNDSHDAARLIMPDLLREIRVDGALVAAPLRPQLVLFCGRNDAAALQRLAELARKEFEAGGRMVGIDLYELNDDHWNLLQLPRDHPAYWPLSFNHRYELCAVYNDQSKLLEEQFKQSGRDCYVAKLSLSQLTDSPVCYTYALWVNLITDALLPKADMVVLCVDQETKRFERVLWDDLITHCGQRMRPTPEGAGEEALVRYHLETFPSEDELAKLTFIAPDAIANAFS